MNRKNTFVKICDKIDQDKQVIASMLYDAQTGDEFFFGVYRLVYNGTASLHGKVLHSISLYKGKTLETRVIADID